MSEGRGTGVVFRGLLLLAAILVIAPLVSAGICSSNGFPTNGGFDCEFVRDPAQMLGCPSHVHYNCNQYPSKYQNGCIGYDYYDFSGSWADFSATQSGGVCYHGGDYCYAAISYNDARCGFSPYQPPAPSTPPYTPPYAPPYTPPAPSTPGQTYPYYPPFPYCGNGVCELGENQFNCPFDCFAPPFPFLSSCTLTAYPGAIAAGQTSTIAVNYFNAPWEPGTAFVNCGNGQSAVAYGCYGYTGVCFAYCPYPTGGTFQASAYAGGVACRSTSVTASGGNGGNGGNGGGGTVIIVVPTPTPTPTPTPAPKRCTVTTNPGTLIENGTSSITISYSGMIPQPQGQVVCGDGQTVAAACSGSDTGSCSATCIFQKPLNLPAHYRVDATLDGVSCVSGGVNLVKSTNPGILVVRVVNQTLIPVANAQVATAGLLQGTNVSGETSFTLPEGSYDVRASKPKFTTAVGTASVVRDKGSLLVLQINELFDPSCSLRVTPLVIYGGSNAVATVSFTDQVSMPTNVLISCGNGQTAQATCTGSPANGSCSAACSYPASALDVKTYQVAATLSGTKCGTQSVRVVPPLPTQGNLVAKVTSCATGESLSGAEVRMFSPSPSIPVNFSGDGTYNLTVGQTVRADNSMVVRLDQNTQGTPSSTDTLSLSTGERNFPTSATDTTTVGLSFVRLTSGLVAPFSFGAVTTNTIYFIPDSTPAGKGVQGVIFYQDPTTANFVPFLAQNAEGSVLYSSGTSINASGLTSATIVNSTNNTGCNSTFTTPTPLSSFNNFVVTSPLNLTSGTPTVSGYNLNNFVGTATVSAQSVNASCTPGNFTINFQTSNGSISPGLGAAGVTYQIARNSVLYDYGVPVQLEFNSAGITTGLNDPNQGNGNVIAIPEYLDASNTTLGAFLFDVGFGDQPTPRLAPVSGAFDVYNETFVPKTTRGTIQANGFTSPRGSNATVSLTSATLIYARTLAEPTSLISVLNAQGQFLQQFQLARNQTGATNDVSVRVLSIAGNSSRIDVRSLTQIAQPTTTFFTNEFGQVAISAAPGTYNLQAFAKNFQTGNATATVTQASNTLVSICLKPALCDFNVTMVSAPTCDFSSDAYQFQIVNAVNQSKNLTLTYSTTDLVGPNVVVVGPQQTTIVTLRARQSSPAVSGQSLGSVSLSDGANACTTAFILPLCVAQEITLQIPQNQLSTNPGQAVCTAALVRNRGLDNVQVTLTADSSVSSMRSTINPDTVYLTPLEVRSVNVCLTPPSGFSGSASATVRANSAFGQANSSVTVSALGQTFYSTDFNGCPVIDAARTTNYAITLRNSAQDGDYSFELENNALTTLTSFPILQWQKDSTRAVTLQIQPQSVKAGKTYVNAYLKKDGATLFQQTLCFDIRGNAATVSSLNENVVDLPRGQSHTSFLTVSNVGSLKGQYVIQIGTTPLSVTVNPSQFTLSPGETQVVEVTVLSSQAQAASTYTIPIKTISTALAETPIAQQDVSVQCGNGQQVQLSCPGGSGTCTATCTYGDAGLFTPSATIAGVSCNTASGTVRVRTDTRNTCTLFASPNSIDRGGSVTVTASYNQLDAPLNGTLSINCGNGVVVNATSCTGNSGACSVACSYPSEGNYVVTASTGSIACAEARVAVANPAIQSCLISSSPNTILRGESSSISLRYNNLPVSGATSSALPVPILAATNNLLVNLVDQTQTLVLSTATLTLDPIPPQQVFPGTTVSIPVTVRNDNYFAVDNVLVFAQNLPPGVVSTPPAKFSLNPGESKTVYVRAEATPNAQLGTRQIDVFADSALTSRVSQKVYFSVLASPTAQLNVAVRISSTGLVNGSQYTVDVTVHNNEPVALLITPSLVLPQGWSYTLQPTSASIAPNGEAIFQAHITAFNPEPGKEYNATLVLSSSDGRAQRFDFKLTPQGGDILSGFITLGDSILGAGFAVALFLLAVALLFFGAMHHHRRR